MALLFMDSFDHYATADLTEKWTQLVGSLGGTPTAAVIGAYGRNSTQGLYVACGAGASNHGDGVGLTLAPSGAVCLVGMAVKVSAFSPLSTSGDTDEDGSGQNYLVACRNGAEKAWFVRVNTDGTLSVCRDHATTPVVLGTSATSLQAGVWAYLEVKVTVHDSTGTVDLRINGVSEIALTGQNTRGTASANAWTNLRVGYIDVTSATAVNLSVDDFVVMDGSGSYNNAFIGDVTVSALYPNGAGTTSGWTPSAGSNYQCVDEALVNDDTDYVSTSVATTKDTYAFANAPAGADIRAVQIVTAQRKGAEGPGKIKHVVRSNSTDYDQTEQGIGGTSYAFLRTVLETDPATAAAWSESGFNAAEFGIKKTG